MPVESAKRVVKKAAGRIRKASAAVREHWTNEEADRRREVADRMQSRLIKALGLVPARVDRPR